MARWFWKVACFFTLLVPLCGAAQNVDSLVLELADVTSKDDSAELINNIVNGYFASGEMVTSTEWCLIGIKMYEGKPNSRHFARFSMNMAVLCLSVMRSEPALKYARKTMKSLGTDSLELGRLKLVNNLAAIFEDLGNSDSADFYYQQALLLIDGSGLPPGIPATCYGNYGNFLAKSGNIKGLYYDSIALTYIDQLEDHDMVWHTTRTNIAHDYLLLSQPRKAIEIMEETIEDESLQYDYYTSSLLLSTAYEQIGEHEKALQLYKQYFIEHDSIQRNEKDKVELLEAKFELERLKLENALERAEIERKSSNVIALAVVSVLLLLLLILAFVFMRKNQAYSRELSEKNKALMIERKRLELKALVAQIKPHFIFNVMNSIQKFIAKNDRDASFETLGKFGEMMRSVLDHSNRSFVPVQDELSSLVNYVDMERLRFDKKLAFNIQLINIPSPSDLKIPPMLIQPVVENAIWHGLSAVPEGGTIELRLVAESDIVHCEVRDDGIGVSVTGSKNHLRDEEDSLHGLDITRERLSVIWGDKGGQPSFTIVNRSAVSEGRGTLVKFQLPTDF